MPNNTIHKVRNTSRVRMCISYTKSALEANFKARANSNKPSVTLMVLSHPPDLGILFNQLGTMANKPKGSAKPNPKPKKPNKGPVGELVTKGSKLPIKIPVQENETIDKVVAIKKMPRKPPLSLCVSILVSHELGSTIAKAPKKLIPKTSNIKKKKILNTAPEARLF